MRRSSLNLPVALVATLVVGLAAGSAEAGYMVGFTWDRSVDYDAGTVHGSSLGNPNTDAEGNPVWSMESTNSAGDGLGGANPWYKGATQLQVWDNSWYGGGPVWARGDNTNPPIGSTGLTHNISSGGTYGNVPLIRWINPIDRDVQIDIDGDLTVLWRGGGGQAGNVDFDVAIAMVDVSEGTTNLLWGELYEKPTDDTSWESLSMPVAISGLWLEPGDELLIGHRGQGTAGNTWPNLADNLTLTITGIVPEPSALALAVVGLAGCGGLLGRRRRRRPTRRRAGGG
jgi:hypothetical protein